MRLPGQYGDIDAEYVECRTGKSKYEREYHHSGDEREGTAPQSGTSVHVAECNHPPPFYESSMSGKVPARRDANGISVVNYSWYSA
jgi:hypothetical protein